MRGGILTAPHRSTSDRVTAGLHTVLAAAAVAFAVSVLPGVRPSGSGHVVALDFWLNSAVMVLAAACLALRAVRDARERGAWAAFAAAVVVYLLGDLYYDLRLADLPPDQVPYPSWADAGWLGWYPLLAVGLVRLVRARVRGASTTLWLDGLGAGAGAAAVVGALLLQPLLQLSAGDPLLVVTNLAYPVADLALLLVAVAAVHLQGWRPDRTWAGLIVGGTVLLVGDTVYMLQLTHGTYADGGIVDASWPIACASFGLAAGGRSPGRRPARGQRMAPLVPVALSLAGTAVLAAGAASETRLPAVVCLLGALSVLLASSRLLLTLQEARRLADARREARTDELTGLPNRRELMVRLNRIVRSGDRRRRRTGAVLLIDLDRFKEVNDTLGHHHGDELLRAVARRLQGVFREGDTVARLGGDEFAVLLPDVDDEASAVALARRCTTALEEDFIIEGLTLSVEASVGLALAPEHGDDGNALIRAADVAMYEAKAGGLDVAVYDAASDVHTPTRLALLGDLRRALQNDDEIVLHYQPKVDLATNVVAGVEALVRWHHPTRGLLAPVEFVPAAESTGLILPLTERTLRLAVTEASAWRRAGAPLQVAVNLSPRCLLEPDLPTRISAMLDENDLPAHLLRLELTETTLMVDPARALAILADLHERGVSLSIDDFGTGYSSMSYLNRMPVDELKIDRGFVLDMLTSDRDGILVRSSIELGHSLGLSVVAEGVEDEATLAALSRLGCDVVQGYHLGRPMRGADILPWLSSQDAPRVDAGGNGVGGAPADPPTTTGAPVMVPVGEA